MLNKSLQPLPEKFHGLTDVETRYRQRYVDLIANIEVRDIFRKRACVIGTIRQYLNERGFIEVDTPILHPSVGGAAARPFMTHYNALDQDYYLRIALELHLKRLIVGGYEKVYEIGRCFRNEGIDTRHNPEFTMMECYQAYADYQDVMRNTEEMVHAAVVAATGSEKVHYGDIEINFALPWKRLDFRQAITDACGIDYVKYPDQVSLFKAMQDRGIKADHRRERGKLIDDLLSEFVEPSLINPTFLVDYPLDMSPLAKTKEDDPLTVERFELFAGGMELANAFSELNDPQEQRRRFAKQLAAKQDGKEAALLEKEEETIDEDFINALEYGMPPTGGLGIGIDRLIMLISGQTSIREVVLFPQLKSKE
jgi:lysyl-tRNA synthetase class 2